MTDQSLVEYLDNLNDKTCYEAARRIEELLREIENLEYEWKEHLDTHYCDFA